MYNNRTAYHKFFLCTIIWWNYCFSSVISSLLHSLTHLRHKEEENKKIKKIIHFSIKNQRSCSVLQKSINMQKALTIQLIFLHNYQHHYNHHSHLLLKTNFSSHNFYWLASDFGLGGVAYIVDKPVCNSYYGPIDSGL